MAHLVSFLVNGERRPGAVKDGRVLDLCAAGLPAGPDGDLLDIVRGGADRLAVIAAAIERWNGPDHALSDVTLCAPIQWPSKIICIGLNYIDHCHESGMPVPTEPVLFSKYSTSVAGPFEDIPWYSDTCNDIDYEAELGVVIGTVASRVSKAAALDHVFGYAVVNDVSARDLQLKPPGQWDAGKAIDKFCPYGPGIVTVDEIPDPQNLAIGLTVNGEQRQKSNTSNMVFGVAELIAFVSRTITLMPGDLIATGTPPGVALGMKPPIWLKDGDVVETTIEKIGSIRNTMRTLS
jgi:2-keto-4-pentenoate hydratase/2-oxohepta-3-ene-1,7-dioic acid hydratase in catechol pathway